MDKRTYFTLSMYIYVPVQNRTFDLILVGGSSLTSIWQTFEKMKENPFNKLNNILANVFPYNLSVSGLTIDRPIARKWTGKVFFS